MKTKNRKQDRFFIVFFNSIKENGGLLIGNVGYRLVEGELFINRERIAEYIKDTAVGTIVITNFIEVEEYEFDEFFKKNV